MRKKYKILSADTVKSLIEFLDEIQFDAAAKENDKDSMHIVNFCSWAITELLNSYDGYLREKPKKKSRDDYVDETFMDWNLPEMTDEEYEKLVDQFDAFLRSWEKEYLKQNPDKKIKKEPRQKPIQKQEYKPPVEDIMEYCTLEEIADFLKDDPELNDNERFELYYDEHLRVQKEKKKANDMLKKEYKKYKVNRKKNNRKNK